MPFKKVSGDNIWAILLAVVSVMGISLALFTIISPDYRRFFPAALAAIAVLGYSGWTGWRLAQRQL